MTVQNVEATRGDDEVYELRVAETEGGPAQDLTGAEALTLTVRRGLREPVLFQKSLGAGIEVTDALGGVALITVDAGDTLPLPNRRISLVYDVELRDSAGRTSTPVTGRLTVQPDVT